MFGLGSLKSETVLLIDIATESVACAFASIEKGINPEIHYSRRFTFGNGDNTKSLEERMLFALEGILKDTHKEGLKILREKKKSSKIKLCIISLSSFWYKTTLLNKKIENKNGIRLSPEYLKNFLIKEDSFFKKELKDLFKADSDIFEANILGVKANGYPLKEWNNTFSNSFEITILLEGGSKKLLRKIEDKILFYFMTEKGIAVHGINSMLSKLLIKFFGQNHSALLVDLSSETSDFLYMKDGYPDKFWQLSFGVENVIEAISKNFDMPKEIAESILSLYTKKLLTIEYMKELDKIFMEAEEEWGLQNEIQKDNPQGLSMQDIYLVSDTNFPEIGKAILSEIFPQKQITILDCQNGFLKKCLTSPAGERNDGHLAVLGTYSQFFNEI